MFHVKHDNPLNNPTTPTTTQNPYGETHPKKPAHQANTLTENELLKSSHVLWPTEKSNRIPPTVKKNFRLFSGFTWNTNSSATMGGKTVLKNHPPQLNHPVLSFTWNTLPALRRHKTMFHVKQPNRHKLSEDAICCSTAPHSFSAFHVKQLVCCRDAMFHVKHSAEYPPNPQWHSAAFQPAYAWYRFHCWEKALFPEAMATGKSEMGDLFSWFTVCLNELSTHTKTSMFHVKHGRLL